MQPEDQEQEIELQQEPIVIGGKVDSVNGQTGDVVLTTSDLENTANFQNANDVANSISAHNQSTSAHQDIRQLITNEATARYNADNNLQGQIDAITSASDVVDIVGTYADLQAYDTQHLKDNDVIKVLQDETHNDAMTYYRWSTSTHTWTYIGAEGPYYTKSETNTLLDDKLDKDEVPEGFFDGPATVTPTQGTSIEIEGGLKLKSIEFYGDTTQQTYSGKNLLNLPTTTRTENGVVVKVSGTNHVVASGLTEDTAGVYFSTFINIDFDITGNFTFSTSEALPRPLYIRFYDNADTNLGQISITAGNTSATGTIPSTATKYRVLFAPAANTQYDFDIYLQFETGTTATTIEPFVGGIASPNPDYPQTVDVVTGTQGIWMHGKNIFTFGTSSATRQGITWVCSGDTATGSGTATQTWTDVTPKIALPTPLPIGAYTFSIPSALSKKVDAYFGHADGTRSSISLSAGQTSKTVTIAKETVNIYIALGDITVNETIDLELSNFQIESGSTVTTYEPYQGSTYTVNLGSIELCKIDTYQDYIYKSGDNWYLHKEVGSLLLDSTSANWEYNKRSDAYSLNKSYLTDYLMSSGTTDYKITTFTPVATAVVGSTPIGSAYMGATYLNLIYDGTSTSAGLSAFKTWLASSNSYFYAPLATATNTKIINSTLIGQLNAILDAGLYQPTTTISASGNLPAILSAEAFTENLNSLLEIASEPNENVFVGTDGVSAGVSGLVPAPATTDAGKFLKADGTWASGGGGGTSYTAGTGIDITSDVISVDTSVIQEKLSAGSNVSISNSNVISSTDTTYTAGTNVNISAQNVISATDTTYTAGTNVSISAGNVISATDTTYSDFTGTDGNTDGVAGLVPAPTTSDTGKFLKSDGTWATAGGGGGGPTVVQTTGTSQTDVMSQNAVTSMVFYDPSTKYGVMIGNNSGINTPQNAVCIGHNVQANTESVVIGENAKAVTANGVAIGRGSSVSGKGCIALGDQTVVGTNVAGVMSIKPNVVSYSYNSSGYRLLTGLYDGQGANDAVNLKQLNALIDDINTALGTSIPHQGA